MQWQKTVLHNLCEVTSSKRIYASEYQSEGIPFYRGREISEKYNGNFDISTELFITESKYNEIKRKFGVPQPGDLLLTSVGTLGNPYVVKDGEVFYFKDGNLTWFRNFKGLDSKYLFYWLVSPQGKAELKKCTIGSSQSAFTIVLLKDMQIAIPPLSTQRRIAEILSAYDDLIENNTRRIRILERMAQSVYREWFGQASAESLPEGWEVTTLGQVCNIVMGQSPASNFYNEEAKGFWRPFPNGQSVLYG
jgi:type I restriction enzyme, S subunit